MYNKTPPSTESRGAPRRQSKAADSPVKVADFGLAAMIRVGEGVDTLKTMCGGEPPKMSFGCLSTPLLHSICVLVPSAFWHLACSDG
jgi:hypothetical protein